MKRARPPFGQALYEARSARRMVAREFYLQLNRLRKGKPIIYPSTLSGYEQGSEGPPSEEIIRDIEQVLGLPPGELSQHLTEENARIYREIGEEIRRHDEGFTQAIQKIREKQGTADNRGKTSPGEGVVECPVCRQKLAYRVHGNGHIWGRCETPDCLSWMQ